MDHKKQAEPFTTICHEQKHGPFPVYKQSVCPGSHFSVSSCQSFYFYPGIISHVKYIPCKFVLEAEGTAMLFFIYSEKYYWERLSGVSVPQRKLPSRVWRTGYTERNVFVKFRQCPPENVATKWGVQEGEATDIIIKERPCCTWL